MSNTIISRRYARALLNLSARANEVEAVAEGLNDVADAVTTSPALADLLINPKVKQADKMQIVNTVLARIGPPAIVSTFVRYLTGKRRIALLDDIRRVYHELADIRTGRATALVTVAVPLDDGQQDQLRRRIEAMSGKQITLDIQVDPAILGGTVTRIGSTVWDGSLRSKLHQIRDSIIQVGL